MATSPTNLAGGVGAVEYRFFADTAGWAGVGFNVPNAIPTPIAIARAV